MLNAFLQGLRELGYMEGENLTIERRYANGSSDQLRELAAELVRSKPDIIVAFSTTAARPAKQETGTIPIVAVAMADPVADELVTSLARPAPRSTPPQGASIRVSPRRPRRPRHRLRPHLPAQKEKLISPPSWPDSASASRKSTRGFGSSPSSTMIWAISIWSREPCKPSTTHLGLGCHLCLRYVLLPMSPVRTVILLVAEVRYSHSPRSIALSFPFGFHRKPG
jgi:ABC transporter substrate binding protein